MFFRRLFEVLNRFTRPRPTSTCVLRPPIKAPTATLQLCRPSEKIRSSLSSQSPDILFVTHGVNTQYQPLTDLPPFDSVIFALGDPTLPPTGNYWKGGSWRLQVWITIHNLSNDVIVVFDIHTDVYHVSACEQRPAMILYAPRITLTQDNSILSQGQQIMLASGEAQPIELLLETSLYDTRDTAIVFGLFFDYQLRENGQVKKYRAPSDKIFVFEHTWRWGPDKCQFKSLGVEGIEQMIRDAKPPNRNYCESLREIAVRHRERLSLLP
jgi:hypothetical protein